MLEGLFGALKILWMVFVALWKIPDFRETVLLSLITAAVAILMGRMDCTAKEIGTTCSIIELAVLLSALFVI